MLKHPTSNLPPSLMLRRHTAFTLIELLVVMTLTALLIAMFMTALANSRATADRALCLSNIGQLEKAHWSYIVDHDGALLGTASTDPKSSWITALKAYEGQLLMRSPVDTSPHFGGGTPVNEQFRLTSYAINANLSPDQPGGIGLIDNVAKPSESVHFVIKAFAGPSAVKNHVNPNAWKASGFQTAMANAARDLQVNAHGGEADSPQARSAYGFLDGHAEQLPFEEVYGSADENRFTPAGWGQGNRPEPK